jgi:hypothetical protein
MAGEPTRPPYNVLRAVTNRIPHLGNGGPPCVV